MYGYGRGMGWTGAFTSYGNEYQGQRCATADGQGNIICGGTEESTFMGNQGCRPTTLNVPDIGETPLCFTSPYNTPGTLYCCPPGRPGAGASQPSTVSQAAVSRSEIQELQRWLESIGCSVGSSGVDGRWGPDTAAAVACAEGQGNARVIASEFPWVATMRVTPTGQPRPANFTFDPGLTKKTPEQVVASGGRSGGSASNTGSTQADLDAERRRQEEAGIFASLPWWGWALIAVGGATVLGFAGLMLLGDDEEEMLPGADLDDDDWDLEPDYLSQYRYGRG